MLTKNGKMVCHINNTNNRLSDTTHGYNDQNTYCTLSISEFTAFLNSLYLAVGTGTSEPNASDYKITNADIGLTVINRTNTLNSQGDAVQDYIAIFTTTYRNDTSEDIIATEVGILGTMPRYGSSSGGIIARDVFSTPVTIAPGESYTFSMYIG